MVEEWYTVATNNMTYIKNININCKVTKKYSLFRRGHILTELEIPMFKYMKTENRRSWNCVDIICL